MSDTSISKPDESQHALSREWLVARIVVIGGFVVAVLTVIWFGWVQPELQRRAAIARVQEHNRETAMAAGQLCRSALTASQSFGIVPNYAQISGSKLYITNVQGRYICVAATRAAKYIVAVDLLCHDVKDRRCVSLFSVIDGNGTPLYRRQS
jgi:hypothetical protein